MTLAEQLRLAMAQVHDIAAQPTTPRDRLVQLRGLTEQVFCGLTRFADVTLADHFARIEYCKRRGHVPAALITHAHRFRVIGNRVVHAEAYAGTDDDVQVGIDLIIAVARFAGVDAPDIAIVRTPDLFDDTETVDVFVTPAPPMPTSPRLHPGSRIDTRALVLSPLQTESESASSATIEIALDLGEEPVVRTLRLEGPWSSTPAWPFVTLWLHQILIADDGTLIADTESLVVVEPDIAVNARAVSKCYVDGSSNVALHFGKLVEPFTISSHLTAGNLGAQAFARMLTDGSSNYEELLDEATADCLDEVALLGEADARSAREKIARQLPVLQDTATFARAGNTAVEAFFIADRLGLQGKPDALVSHTGREFVLELKTGKGPFAEVDMPLQAGGTLRLPDRVDHVIQVACYAMIQHDIEGMTFTPVLLYPAESQKQKQSCRIELSQILRVEIMTTRNALVAAEHRITEAKVPFPADQVGQPGPKSFNKEAYKSALKFARVFEVFAAGTGTDRHAWFVRQIQHIYRELWADRLGSIDGERTKPGFSALWTDPDMRGKVQRGEALVAMRERVELRQDRLLTFEVDPIMLATCEFRDDDMVLLYPQVAGDRAPTRRRLLKARFRGRDATDAGLVRLEATDPVDAAYLGAHPRWAMTSDRSESTANQLAALWSMATNARHKVDLLTGAAAPGTPPLEGDEGRNSHIDTLVARAAASPDYFLLQGPPGTGKTRRFLPSLVRTRLALDTRPILAVAFTNRAVDEMRQTLAAVAPIDPFIDGDEDGSHELAVDDRLRRKRDRLAQSQIFVMTVHKAWRRLEWLRSLRPQMVIVDEASQLVDAMVAGLFSLDAPFVMIGDHRQLPPIVQRPRRIAGEAGSITAEDEPAVSTFERMIDSCRREGWDHAHGMLVEQHRMHEEIQAFPSMNAYNGRLSCGSERQRRQGSPWAGKPGLPSAITDRRVCFVDVGADAGDPARVNRREAVLAAELAARFVRTADQVDEAHVGSGGTCVGIVAPFRVQCAAIRNELHRLGLADAVHVDTVERFQGSERPVMIVSMTARNQQELARTESLALDGLVDRKLNVAITRAREHLIVLGDREVLGMGIKTAEYLSFLEMSEQVVPANIVRAQLGLD